jgi:hypothetical protein
MPFRLTNVLATFQRFINKVLGEHLDVFIVAYLNDILIFLKTKEQHIKYIQAILKKLHYAKLQLRAKKYEFYV